LSAATVLITMTAQPIIAWKPPTGGFLASGVSPYRPPSWPLPRHVPTWPGSPRMRKQGVRASRTKSKLHTVPSRSTRASLLVPGTVWSGRWRYIPRTARTPGYGIARSWPFSRILRHPVVQNHVHARREVHAACRGYKHLVPAPVGYRGPEGPVLWPEYVKGPLRVRVADQV
jgi:hypothetical protein